MNHTDTPNVRTTTDLQRCIAFSMIRGINQASARHLLGLLGDVDNFFDMSSRELAGLTQLSPGIIDSTYRQHLLDAAAAEVDFVQTHNIRCQFVGDNDYPERLLACDDAPAMLYSLGADATSPRRSVAIVGTRHATAYGNKIAEQIVTDLASMPGSLTIISGLAYGIDVAAHRAALAAGVPTACVVAHGLNTIYPAEHRQVASEVVRSGGCIITEYPSSSAIHKGNFLARNRIIAGLADITIVVESDLRGGAMSTAAIANAYGREVAALPGRVTDKYSRGCNDLIMRNAAHMIRTARDICDIMQWPLEPDKPEQKTLFNEASPLQNRILELLRQNVDFTADDLARQLDMPLSSMNSELFRMSMADMIVQLPGGSFTPLV